MAKISHYVVTYNHETHELDYDVETTLARFTDGWIYDEETEEWGMAEEVPEYGNDLDGETILINLLRDDHKKRLEPNG